jgi:iron complex outermembrane receptor protein
MPHAPSVARRLVVLLLLAAASPAAAQDSTRARPDTVRLPDLEATSTRPTDVLRNTLTVPVDRIPLTTISRLGTPELTQTLNFALPSFQSTTQTQADANDHVDFAQVRGLGSDQLLVLVNGKRRHQSALLHLGDNIGQGTTGVDLNSIPTAAIERIEFLRDGAAAQYGSDAISGVINIVLKQNVNTGALNALSGVTAEGDGFQFRADANYGIRLGRNGFLDFTAEYRRRDPFNRVGRWNGNVYFGNLFNFGDFGPNGEYNSEEEFQADLARIAERGFDLDNVQRIGDSKLENGNFLVNGALPIARNAEAYVFAGLTLRGSEAGAFYRFPADANVSNLAIYPDGYLPLIRTDIRDNSIAAGVRGSLGAWNWDVSNNFGGNRVGFEVANTLNASLRDASPTEFDAGALTYRQNVLRAEANRYFTPRGISGLALALGAEFRAEHYGIDAGEEASWRNYATGPGDTTATGGTFDSGSEGFPGFQPRTEVSEGRTNIGLYADAELEISPRLTLGVAGRWEDYSDFGNRATFKVAGRWQPMTPVTVRASFNTGFRAPSLAQTWSNRVSTIFSDNRETVVGLFNNRSAQVEALGVAPLAPETSRNWAAGIVLEPLERLTVSVDGYWIDVDDRIVASGVLGRFDDPAIDAALAPFPDVDAVQFFSNAVDTRTRGLDIQASYPFLVGQGVLTVTGVANFNETAIQGAVRTPTGIGALDLFNPQERSWIEDALPGSKFILGGKYEVGRFGALVRTTRFGSVESVNIFGPNETVPAAWITDFNVSYRFADRYQVALGANNVFDKLPPTQDYFNSYFGIFQYSRVAPYGIRGAFWYGTVSVAL